MQSYDDFKYVLQDSGRIYFGRELTYEEMLKREDVPFKFQAVLHAYMLKEVSPTCKMAEHVLQVEEDSFMGRVFGQLKLEVKFFFKEEKTGLGGKKKEKWVHKSCTFAKFQQEYQDMVQNGEASIEELAISKLALMTISL